MDWNDWHARVWRGNAAAVARAVIPTGFRELDRALPGGGWPLGAITEIFVDGYGIGELELLMPALAALTKEDPAKPKKWVAWIAPPFVPYAPALQQHGVNIDRLLMIHPPSGLKSRLWAIEQTVRSGSSAGVFAWVAVGDAGRDARGRATQARAGMPAVGQRREQLPRAVAEAHAATRVEIVKCRGGRPGVVDVAGFALHAAASGQASRQ